MATPPALAVMAESDWIFENSRESARFMKTYSNIDLFKFIAAIFVVAIHTDPLANCKGEFFYYPLNMIFLTAVPFFFLSTGFLLGKKCFAGDAVILSDEGRISYLKGYLLKMIKLYLIWTAVYMPLTVKSYIDWGYSLRYAVKDFFTGLIFVGQHYNSWILWYILSTVYTVTLIIIMAKKKYSTEAILAAGFAFYLISIGADWIVNEEHTSAVLLFLERIIGETVESGRIFRGFLYIPMGIYISKYEGEANTPVLALVSIAAFVTGSVFYENMIVLRFILPVLMFCFFQLLLKVRFDHPEIAKFLRRNSTVIYFIHLWVWSVYYYIVYGKKTHGFYVFLFTALITLVISMTYVCLRYYLLPKLKCRRCENESAAGEDNR